ncbi:MAG: flippase-like domain-containing protein [Gemmatimonadetes bacterium]|nr:flippase-like domain-containing protein [Gemmatimonadota bacterium]
MIARPPAWLRVVVSVGILVALATLLDGAAVLRRLADLDLRWVAVALVVSVVQVAGSAWRWRYTAGRLGVRLDLGRAIAEYYRATFLNQVLPGGVVGDVSRAWRHRGAEHDDPALRLAAVHAVVLERASGQLVMTAVAVVSAGILMAGVGAPLAAWVGLAAATLGSAVGGGLAARRPARGGWAGRLVADARLALGGAALPVQLASSALVVATYLVTWVAAARGIGSSVPLDDLLLVAGPVLVAMLLPVSIAGWGVREAAAAFLWGSVAATAGATEGVAVSIAYGALVLAASLPGAALLLLSPPDQGRRARPSRDGSGAPADAAPRPGSESSEG